MERLQKVLARAGVASRRHAEELITAGRVRVNGEPATQLGTCVDPQRDAISVDGRPVRPLQEQAYLALHKPRGFVTTAFDPQRRRTAMELVPEIPGLFSVGRLDADSSGLLLLTTDGDWAERLAHPRYGSEKEYLVEVTGRVAPEAVEALRRPMLIGPEERTSGADVRVLEADRDRTLLAVVLHEGRNRQIRRMMEAVGYRVRRLHRVRVGGIELGGLPEGEWRELTAVEVRAAGKPHPPTPSPHGGEGEIRLEDYRKSARTIRLRRRSA